MQPETEPTPRMDVATFANWQAKGRLALCKRNKQLGDLMAEHAVLELACMLPEEAKAAAVWLHAGHFIGVNHGKLWRGILAHHERGERVDVALAAGDDEGARAAAITILSLGMYPLPVAFPRYCRTVAEWASVRQAMVEVGLTEREAANLTPAEIMQRLKSMQADLPATASEAAVQAVTTAKQMATEAWQEFYGALPDAGKPLPTTLDALDRALGGGLRTDRPVVIGAGTSVGKTALAMQIALDAARTTPVYVVNAESTRRVWRQRALAHLGRTPLTAIMDRTTPDVEIQDAVQFLSDLDLVIDDGRIGDKRANLDVSAVCERILTAHAAKPLGLVVIDYITKLTIRERFDRPDLRVAAISERLAALCRQLECPMLVLSQLNTKDRPNEDSLRESKAVGHDAGTIVLLWHPQPSDPSKVELIVVKPKIAPQPCIPLHFDGPLQRFKPRVADPFVPVSNARNSRSPNKSGNKRGNPGEDHE